MTDKLIVSAIDCVVSLGVTPEERAVKQRLSIDVEISTDTRKAARSDSLEDAIDYGGIVTLIADLSRRGEYRLIETLAEEIAARVLGYSGGVAVCVRVRKRPPPLDARIGFASVEIVRTAPKPV